MAEVIWAEPALSDLEEIANYIAPDNPEAARRLVRKIFDQKMLALPDDVTPPNKFGQSGRSFRLRGSGIGTDPNLKLKAIKRRFSW